MFKCVSKFLASAEISFIASKSFSGIYGQCSLQNNKLTENTSPEEIAKSIGLHGNITSRISPFTDMEVGETQVIQKCDFNNISKDCQ